MDAAHPDRFGPWRLRTTPWHGFGLVVDGLVHDDDAPVPADYVSAVLLTPQHSDAFFALVDAAGVVVCKNVGGDDGGLKDVRGRSSRGKLSQGEFYHHDGCKGPVRPRVVEIRCPYQDVQRATLTAVAPFPSTVYAMLLALPAALVIDRLAAWRLALVSDGGLPEDSWDLVQGELNRTIRRAMSSADARRFLRDVDVQVGAYCEPWSMGETRFIANDNGSRTAQHRRACIDLVIGKPSGRLAKRWPSQALQPGD